MPFSARVLVLDTDKSHPLSIGDLLEAHGYYSMHASSIEEAAKIAGSSYPDLAVVNATTKDLNGEGLIRSLKKAWPAEHMPLILVGDHGAAEQQTLDLVEGMADFLPLPFEDFELTARLRSLARLIPNCAGCDSRRGFPNGRKSESMWRTDEEVRHGSSACLAGRF